jgi:hypothetical protein
MEVRNDDGTKITANKNYLGQHEKDKPIAKKYRKERINQASNLPDVKSYFSISKWPDFDL